MHAYETAKSRTVPRLYSEAAQWLMQDSVPVRKIACGQPTRVC